MTKAPQGEWIFVEATCNLAGVGPLGSFVAWAPGRDLERLGAQRLREAIALAGLADVEVVYRQVESLDDAVRLGFGGSPSFLINGVDPFPSTAQAGGLTCSLYPTDGGLQGAPTVESLIRALVDAVEPTAPPTGMGL